MGELSWAEKVDRKIQKRELRRVEGRLAWFRGWRHGGETDAGIAERANFRYWQNIVRPGEPWTPADVRAVLAKGGEG